MKSIFKYIVILSLFVPIVSCEKDDENPDIETTKITALSATRFYVKGTVKETGDKKITDYGFIYSLGTNPPSSITGGESKVSMGSSLSTDTFSTSIIVNDSYYSNSINCYVRAYITNEKGTVYANVIAAPILKMSATGIIPNSGGSGDTVEIIGSNFDTDKSQTFVTFNNVSAEIISITSSRIKVKVPSNLNVSYYENSVSVSVRSGDQTINLSYNFKLVAKPTSFSPKNGTWSTSITIYGSALSNAKVYFNDTQISYYSSYSNYITVNVPTSLRYKSFKIYIEQNGQKTEVPGGSFTMDKMQITTVTPTKCLAGSSVKVNGTGFCPDYNTNKLIIGTNTIVTDSYYSNLSFTIPSSLATGSYTAYVSNGIDTVQLSKKIEIVQPSVTGITPSSGYYGEKFTINGSNFDPSNANVYFGSNSLWNLSSRDSSELIGTVPQIVPGDYNVYVDINSVRYKCPDKFTVKAPTVTSLTPTSGASGTSVIIKGAGFNSSSNTYVYFGSNYAEVMAVSDDQINVKVPSITSGTWMIKVSINGYTIPSSLTFTIP
jgi:hypothetical protein